MIKKEQLRKMSKEDLVTIVYEDQIFSRSTQILINNMERKIRNLKSNNWVYKIFFIIITITLAAVIIYD